MPNYDMRCKECGHRWETSLPSNAPKMERCPICGEMGMWLPSVRVQVFKPMIYTDICEHDILIRSRAHLREECKKHGVRAARLE